MSHIIFVNKQNREKPHRWYNGESARLVCGRSWVRAPIWYTKDYKIGMCCFSTKHTALMRKSKDWLKMARNQDNVSKWGDISILGLLFQ
jgi:hypothetical protein